MVLELNKYYLGEAVETLKKIEDNSIDIICIDPPYLYLNHRLDVEFNELEYFKQVRRVLKDGGFIIIFGRGASFYRWNTIISEMPQNDCSLIDLIKSIFKIKVLPKAFDFKEEIIWAKGYTTAPTLPLNRVHETVAIYAKGKGKINSIKVPYLQMKYYDFEGLKNDIKRLASAIKNTKELKELKDYINGKKEYTRKRVNKHEITLSGITEDNGAGLKTYQSIDSGMKEKSIIKIPREHYKQIHPTQKPVVLIKRLLQLVCKTGDIVVDTFAGSGSTGKACIELGLDYILVDKDEVFRKEGNESINEFKANFQPSLFTFEDFLNDSETL